MTSHPAGRYAPWLWLLLGAFVARVLAQPASLVIQSRFLPPFDSWHSGALPYPLLVTTQVLIVAWLSRTSWRFTFGEAVPNRRIGWPLLVFATSYFVSMLARLVLGATLLGRFRWFASPVPTVFHLVLATYLLLVGHFHARYGPTQEPEKQNREPGLATVVPWLPYPIVMVSAFGMFAWLQSLGLSLMLSTYVPILVTAGIVAWLEFLLPNREEWRPPQSEVRTDLVFMSVVQLVVPPMVGLVFAFALIGPVSQLDLGLARMWPHGWPIWLQAILMILVVDFLRYWLHRAAHENDTLWRLHSVHHSVEQLYWVNTARFHPLEKALQMSLDSLPFLLMGVDAKVLSLYYLAYATNGFFQHCNIRLRYGVLNYIVGSAETHRWHHSRVPKESNANYGNTVIIWDLLFGTWHLPLERDVKELGLQDRDYPKSFFKLMRAPFVR